MPRVLNAGGGRVVRWSWVNFQCRSILQFGEWSGGAVVLGKLLVPESPTIWVIVGQGPIVLAESAGGDCLDFFLSSIFFLLSPLSFLFSFSLSLGDGPI